MIIPVPEMTAEDVAAIREHAQSVMDGTEMVCSSTSIADAANHQTEIETAQSGTESLRNYLEKKLGEIKNSISAVKAMDHDLKRHMERCKRHYWFLKDSQPH